MKKIVIIPDSFKGTMTSKEIGTIMVEEAKACWPEVETVRMEVADGGEGSVDAFLAVRPGEKKHLSVCGPHGEKVQAFYGLLTGTDGAPSMAVIEMAAAAGLPLVGERKDAGQTTTYGVGQLVQAALDSGAKKIVLGLGGSATNDGGVGAAVALGVRFLDENGKTFLPVGDTLCRIAAIDMTQRDARLAHTQVIAMCDIDNPLCGENGATAMYGPQKGVAPHQVQPLDDGLRHLGQTILRDLGLDVLHEKGAGAAGGMGAGTVAFLGAALQSGIDAVLDAVRFDEVLRDCSLVVTGEGKIDAQSVHGKVVAGVARRAQKQGVPVLAVVGDIGNDVSGIYEVGVSAIFSINRVALPYEQAKFRAKNDLRETMRTVFCFAKLARKLS